MLEIENLSAAYGMVQILRDVNFKVEQGEIVSIIGPNGAGKTTLVKTIMGFLHPKTGSMDENRGYRRSSIPRAAPQSDVR